MFHIIIEWYWTLKALCGWDGWDGMGWDGFLNVPIIWALDDDNKEETSIHYINIEVTSSHYIDIEETSSHNTNIEEISSPYINIEETNSHV